MSCRLYQLGGYLISGDAGNKKGSIRAIKKQALRILESSYDYHDLLELCEGSLLRMINILCSFIYHNNPVIKWNAVTAMGSAVSCLAETDMEPARNFIRRLMWNLNDESGGIGWGSAEAMGEILANNENLAIEYRPILFSYARKDGNFQEHELMQRGVLWAIGRFCQAMPQSAEDKEIKNIMPFLKSADAYVRGHAVWIMGYLKAEESIPQLEDLKKDESMIKLFYDKKITDVQVKDLAKEALFRIKSN